MNDDARKAVAVAAALAAGMALLKRSRLSRLAVVGGLAAVAYTRLTRREPTWHDVERPG